LRFYDIYVGGYAVRNTINLRICICTSWFYFSYWIISAWSQII